MPIPPLLKVVWLGKYLLFPIVDSIREYRRKRKARKEAEGVVEQRFWHDPIAAVRDRRLWVKFTTNSAETVVHAIGSLRFGYGFVSRRTRLFYRTWSPDHRHEHELYQQVELKPWREVFVQTWRWLKAALRFYEEDRLERPVISDLSKRSTRWKKIRFDGMVIAAWVPRNKGRFVVREFLRPGSALRLRLLYGEEGMFEVMVMQDRKIAQHLQVLETAINDVTQSIAG